MLGFFFSNFVAFSEYLNFKRKWNFIFKFFGPFVKPFTTETSQRRYDRSLRRIHVDGQSSDLSTRGQDQTSWITQKIKILDNKGDLCWIKYTANIYSF